MNIFGNARLKLTGWYLLIITFLSLVFSFAIYSFQTREIARFEAAQRTRIERRFMNNNSAILIDEELIRDAKNRIRLRLLYLNIMIISVAGALSYYLSGLTLAPIEEMLTRQKEFVSDAAHELKTPLTSLIVSQEVALRAKKVTTGQLKTLLSDNLDDLDHLRKLVDSLLLLASYSEGTPVEFEKIDLKILTQDIIKKYTPELRGRKIKITQELASAKVLGDYSALRILISTLLDNAVKYANPKNGLIWVKLVSRKSKVTIELSDNGQGIKADEKQRIFERFYRSDKARGRNGGFGLGLAIARKIVDRHGGAMQVAERDPSGTTFRVTLPRVS